MRQLAGLPDKWVAAVAVAAAAVAVWVTLDAGFLTYPGWLAAQKADLILGPVLVGLYWRRRRPASQFGPLLILTGLVGGVPYVLQSSSAPVPFAVGVLWEGVIYSFTLALILGFPTGRFEGRAERVLLAVGVSAVVGGYLAVVLLSPQISGQSSISVCAAACPPNGLLIATEPAFVVDVVRVVRILVILVALAAAVLIVMRVVRGTPPRRRALAIGAPVALAFLVSQAAYQTALLFELQAGDFYGVIQWTIVGTRSSIWYGFLFALIAAELYAGRVLRRVVVASLRRPAPADLEAMLRGPLGDPSLRLVLGPAREPLPPGRVQTEIERDGRAAAAIVHDAELAEEPELLRAAGAIALLAEENAELEAGWNTTLRELRASRNRIVAASEIERRKLERDLHDGAQQRLVALRIRLALAREQAIAVPAVEAKLGQLEADLDEAIEELRDLAHGIFPSLLAERGLLAALRAVALRGPRAVQVTGHQVERYPPEIESAVYYCCLEALQNATKHAGAEAQITASLAAENGHLRLEVRDDGPGFDLTAVHAGVGLRNMEDRLGAVRGRLTIVTSPGKGTRISGRVPLNGTVP
jgi:signal transduction histidine kinase